MDSLKEFYAYSQVLRLHFPAGDTMREFSQNYLPSDPAGYGRVQRVAQKYMLARTSSSRLFDSDLVRLLPKIVSKQTLPIHPIVRQFGPRDYQADPRNRAAQPPGQLNVGRHNTHSPLGGSDQRSTIA